MIQWQKISIEITTWIMRIQCLNLGEIYQGDMYGLLAVHHKFSVLFCTVLKSTYKNVIFASLKLSGELKSSISRKIRTFSIPQAVFFVGKCS